MENAADREVVDMRAFNETIARHAPPKSIIVRFGDGLWVAVRF